MDNSQSKPAEAVNPAPNKSPGLIAKAVYLACSLACLVYLLNPGWGVFEILPDNLPFIGNLDEAGITALFILCIKKVFCGKPKK